jgi:hypothetical protein
VISMMYRTSELSLYSNIAKGSKGMELSTRIASLEITMTNIVYIMQL